ncbi:hypothetical protein MN032_18605 [Agromyces atrinae]|uniref:hypothetical protein n=1 Tax=Agromyces atrinae TaxID=592376 RepID=UPI001F566603|nr:hypothetical protein [Agromyces atrinae]MCI2959697.1 hypothetical protein [Agromyces atrinae]
MIAIIAGFAEQCRALRGRCHEIGRGLRRDRRCGLEGSLAARIDAELSPLVRFGGIEAQREHDLLHEIGVHPTAARAEDVVEPLTSRSAPDPGSRRPRCGHRRYV